MEGQIEGAIVMGLGYALTEEFICEVTETFAQFRIAQACGARLRDLPATPEKVPDALKHISDQK